MGLLDRFAQRRDRLSDRWHRVRDNLSRGHVVPEVGSRGDVRPIHPGGKLPKQYRPRGPHRELVFRRAFRGIASLPVRADLARLGYAATLRTVKAQAAQQKPGEWVGGSRHDVGGMFG